MKLSNTHILVLVFVSSLGIFILGVMVTNASAVFSNIWLGVIYFSIWLTLGVFIYLNIIRDYIQSKKNKEKPRGSEDTIMQVSDDRYRDLPLRERVSRYVDERRKYRGETVPPSSVVTSFQKKNYHSQESSQEPDDELPGLPGLSDIEEPGDEFISLSDDIEDIADIPHLDIREPDEVPVDFSETEIIPEIESDKPVLHDDLIGYDNDTQKDMNTENEERETDEIDIHTLEEINPDIKISSFFDTDESEETDFTEMRESDEHSVTEKEIEEEIRFNQDESDVGVEKNQTSPPISTSEPEDNQEGEGDTENELPDLPSIDGDLDSELNPDDFFEDDLDDLDISEDSLP
ncbi:MAG: hypothetical protein JXA44_12805 [Methanospirillaceae archaeon]|nr:hypothetical protein [Methanospirillaceae archaeon]